MWDFQQGEKIGKSSPCRTGLMRQRAIEERLDFQQGGENEKTLPAGKG
jgi:NADH:ubiquinone oxidoreductase subunit F (NADH-binding)